MTQKTYHILHVIGSKGSGGAETFFLRLVEAQHQDKRFHVTCLTREGSWLEKELRKRDIPTLTAPFRKYFDFQTKAYIENLFHILPIDIVQGWMNRACSKLPVSTVPTIGRMGGYYKLKNYNACHVIAGNTVKICEYLLDEALTKEEITYLPNFAETPKKVRSEKEKVTKEALGIPEEDSVFLVAGRLHMVKGIDTAIESLKHLSHAHLLVLGNGKEKDLFETQAQNLGVGDRVHFLGWKNNIADYADISDIWLVPSRHEPLGNVVLDAWMHKVPVIASYSDGPNMLISSGENGLLVPVEDDVALAESITCLLEDPTFAKKLVDAGYKTVQETFSKETVLNRYAHVYEDMLIHDGWVSKYAFKKELNV